MSIKIPFERKKVSVLLALSAIALLLLASPLVSLYNPLLQSVKAQSSTLNFRTQSNGISGQWPNGELAVITFDAQGDDYSTDSNTAEITKGNIQIEILKCCPPTVSKGTINNGTFYNYTHASPGPFITFSATMDHILNNTSYTLMVVCSSSSSGSYEVDFSNEATGVPNNSFLGAAECPIGGGTTTTTTKATQPSSSTNGTTTSQDSDGDGIPDSSDRCDHNSNHRCYKEGDNNTTATTNQPQQPSSSNRTGNQTR